MHSESAHAKAAPKDDVFARSFDFIGCFPAPELDQAWKEWVRFVALSAPLHLVLAKVGTSALTVSSVALILASVLGALLAFVSRSQQLALCLIAATLSLKSVLLFPETPNHLYLHAVIATFTCLGFARQSSERANALKALRWIAVIVLLWAGIQKLVYGVYFRGEYLAYVVSIKPFVRSLLAFAIPEAELQQLVAFGKPSLGDGPYRVSSPFLWLAGNATWLGEIGVAIGLLFERTRKAAVIASFALLAAIEIVMRELVFGALMLSLTGLHLSTRGMQRVSRAALAFLGLLILVRAVATQRQWWFELKDSRRAWLLLVIAFAAWPAIQIRLARTEWVSPWKLMGFGMYATIPPRHTVRLIELRSGRELRIPGIPGKLLAEHKRYSRERASLGSLADPTALGHAFLASRPQAEAVLVEVDITALEASSARFVLARRDRYRFARGGGSSVPPK